jgi:hypothetical protein
MIIMFYPRSPPPIRRLLLLLLVIIQAVTPRGAAEARIEGLSPSSSLVKITSFMKREVSQGDIAPLWFTVASSDDKPQHVNFQVLLPAASVTYREAAVFPPLNDDLAVLHVSEDEDRDMVVVMWTDVALAPGQSRVFNVDVKIEAISERAVVQLEAVVTRGSKLQNSVVLSILPVTLTKRPKITKAYLAEKAVEKRRANPHKGLSNEHEHESFAVCKPLREGPAAVEDCLAACNHEEAQPCLACGYDPWSGCLCKGKGKENKDRYLDDVPVLYEGGWVEEKVEGVENQAAQPYRPLFLDRRGEILIFPGLLIEEQCLDMESFLAELVAEHKTQRYIVPGVGDSPLHALVKRMLPVPGATFEEFVTFSEEDVEVDPHYDEVKNGETHKLLLFLDTVAGTRFWESKESYRKKNCPLVVGPARGTVVIFPMSLYHDSARYEPQYSIKRTLGLRMSLPPFDPVAGESAIGQVQSGGVMEIGPGAATAVAVEAR